MKNTNEEILLPIEQAWRKFIDLDEQYRYDRLLPNSPRFTDCAWDHFDAKTVLTVLIDEKPSYRALKPILFAGLCTWVVCPNRTSLRKHAMLLIGIEHLREAEALGRAVFAKRDLPGRDLLGDTLGRLRVLGHDFYSDFYYPIGGLAQVLRSTTPGNFAKSLAHHAQAARNIVAMMQIYDYHAKHFSDRKKYYKASDGKGYKLAREIRACYRSEIGFSVELSEERWKTLNATAALTYAASTILVSKGRSLFDLICAGEATFEDHRHLLDTWISRARYAAEIILGDFTNSEIGRANTALLPDLPLTPTPEPQFSEAERARECEFDIAKILGGRRQTERQSRKAHRRP